MAYVKAAAFAAVLALLSPALPVHARDAARDLRRMIGYTIIDATSVDQAVQARDGGTVLVLASGRVLKLTDLFLPPLPLTDVIVFRKHVGEAMYLKVLIDNEAHDAILLK
jgi:hypothetical protein